MHLHAFLHRALGRGAGVRFCLRHDQRRLRRVFVHGLQRAEHERARELDVDVEFRGAMLQRLEFADRAVELPALLEVGERALEHGVSQSEQLRRDHRAPEVEHFIEHRAGGVHFAQYRVRLDAHADEAQARCVVRVGHQRALDVYPGGARIDEQQRQAALRSARRHDEAVGHMAVEHEGLRAVQAQAVAVARRRGRNGIRPVLARLVDRNGDHHFGRGDRGQKPGLLRL